MTAGRTDSYGFPIATGFPEATSAMMVEIDYLMAEVVGVGLPLMKENAGRALARLSACRFLGGNPLGRHVVVLVGKGGNGDVALLAARRLAGWGARVSPVLALPPESLGPGARREADILGRLGILPAESLPQDGPDLILDGLIGYSLRGAPRGRVAELIRWANDTCAPILSLDVPTGFDGDAGAFYEPSIRASATLALALPRHRMAAEGFAHAVGDLYLADLSVPPEIWQRLSEPVAVPPFPGFDVVRLMRPGEGDRPA